MGTKDCVGYGTSVHFILFVVASIEGESVSVQTGRLSLKYFQAKAQRDHVAHFPTINLYAICINDNNHVIIKYIILYLLIHVAVCGVHNCLRPQSILTVLVWLWFGFGLAGLICAA